jgi:hypothetical protein
MVDEPMVCTNQRCPWTGMASETDDWHCPDCGEWVEPYSDPAQTTQKPVHRELARSARYGINPNTTYD